MGCVIESTGPIYTPQIIFTHHDIGNAIIVIKLPMYHAQVCQACCYHIPGMTGPPNSFTARGPVTLTAILFTQPAVYKRHLRCLPKTRMPKN